MAQEKQGQIHKLDIFDLAVISTVYIHYNE